MLDMSAFERGMEIKASKNRVLQMKPWSSQKKLLNPLMSSIHTEKTPVLLTGKMKHPFEESVP